MKAAAKVNLVPILLLEKKVLVQGIDTLVKLWLII
jgi:hypothetical protein